MNIRIRYRDKDGNEQEEPLDSVPIVRNISPPLELYDPDTYRDTHPETEESSIVSLRDKFSM